MENPLGGALGSILSFLSTLFQEGASAQDCDKKQLSMTMHWTYHHVTFEADETNTRKN